MPTWNLIDTLPGGHRLFKTDSDCVYIADESGEHPGDTDDGPMYLDLTEPITVGSTAQVPVVSIRDADKFRVGVSLADALWLSDRYRWELRTTGASAYRAVRTS
jgi:hypothetical protein